MKIKELHTERLVLIPLSTKHLSQRYVSWMNDVETNKYLESGGDYTLEKLRSFLEEQEKKEILFWAIHLKENDKHIGNIKIDPVDSSKRSGEYGILIGDKLEWRKGFAKEATNVVIDYCFNTLNLNQITLGVVDRNVNALEMYKRLNFKVYDEKKGSGTYDGVLCNSYRMVLKNE